VTRVTRAVSAGSLQALLEHPPRATLAFVRDDAIDAWPVAFRLIGGRYLFGIDSGAGPLPGKVKLLIDDGPWYYDLRGTWMRGGIARCEPPPGADASLDWYELAPEKTVAWHYGELRDS